MALNNNPVFSASPRIGVGTLTAANTAFDGSGTITSVFTAGTDGARVDRICFQNAKASVAANSAMVGRVFLSPDGTTWTPFDEIAIAAVTSSNTAVGARNELIYPEGLMLPANYQVGVTISVYAGAQDRTNVIVRGASLTA